MALRTIFIQFGSNVSSYAAQMRAAQSASIAFADAQRKHIAALEAETLAIQREELAQRSLNSHLATGLATYNVHGRAIGQTKMLEDDLARSVKATDVAWGNRIRTEEQVALRQSRAVGAEASRMQSLGKMAGLIGIGLVAAMTGAALAAGKFESELERVAIVSGTSSASVQALGRGILELSMRMPVTASELVKGLVAIEQEGYRGADAMAILNAAGRAATVGLGDVEKVSTSMVVIMKAFSLGVTESAQVSNLLIRASQLSQVSLTDMAGALQKTGPIAAGLKIPLDQVVAAITATTRQGLAAGTSAQALNRILTQSLKPNQDLYKEITNLGIAHHGAAFASSAEAYSALGLQGVLKGLTDAHKGNIEAIFRLNPSIRSAAAFFSLMANGGKDLNAVMAEMTDKTKLARIVQEAYNKQINTFSSQMKLAHNDVHAATIELGQAFLPAVRGVVQGVGGLAAEFAGLSSGVRGAIGAFTAIIAAAGVFMGIMGLMTPVLVGTGLTFAELAIPIAAVVAILGAAIFAFGLAAKHAQEGRQAVQTYADAWEAAGGKIGPSTQALVDQNLAAANIIPTLAKYGLSLQTVETAIQGTKGGVAARAEEERKFGIQLGLTDDRLRSQGYTSQQLAQVQTLIRQSVRGNRDSYKELELVLNNTGNSTVQLTDKQREALKVLGIVNQETNRLDQGQQTYINRVREFNTAQGLSNNLLILSGKIIGDTKEEVEALAEENKKLVQTFDGFIGLDAILSNAKHSLEGFTDPLNVFKDASKDMRQEAIDQIRDQHAAEKAEREKHVQELKDIAREKSKSVFSPEYKLALKNAQAAAKEAREADRREQREEEQAAKKATPSLQDYIKSLQEEAKLTDDWNARLASISGKGFQKLSENLRKLGKEGIPLVEQFANATKDQMKAAEDAMTDLGPKTELTLATWEQSMLDQIQKEQEFANAIFKLQGAGYENLARQFLEGGVKTADVAQQAADLVGSKDQKQIDHLKKLNDEAGDVLDITSPEGLQRFRNQFAAVTKIMAGGGLDAVRAFITAADDVNSGAEVLNGIADSLEHSDNKPLADALRKQVQQAIEEAAANAPKGATPPMDDSDKRHSDAANQEAARRGTAPGTAPAPAPPQQGPPLPAAPGPRAPAQTPSGSSSNPTDINFGPSRSGVNPLQPGRHGWWSVPDNLHTASTLPPGSGMTGGYNTPQPTVTVVQVPVPESKINEYNFNGPIQGVKMEDAIAYADRKNRQANSTKVGSYT